MKPLMNADHNKRRHRETVNYRATEKHMKEEGQNLKKEIEKQM